MRKEMAQSSQAGIPIIEAAAAVSPARVVGREIEEA